MKLLLADDLRGMVISKACFSVIVQNKCCELVGLVIEKLPPRHISSAGACVRLTLYQPEVSSNALIVR